MTLRGDARLDGLMALAGRHREEGDVEGQVEVYRGAAFWAAMLAMTVPGRLLGLDAESVALPEVAQRCVELAREAGDRLDARNGTMRYADRINRVVEGIRRTADERRRP